MNVHLYWKTAVLLIAISFLASCGKYKNDLDPETVGAVFQAVESGDIAKLRELFAKNPKIVDARDPATQQTPLMRAAVAKQPVIADFLIKNGADINVKDRYLGQTALHLAAKLDSGEVARLLLEAGANLDQRDNLGKSARDLAIMEESRSVLLLFDKK